MALYLYILYIYMLLNLLNFSFSVIKYWILVVFLYFCIYCTAFYAMLAIFHSHQGKINVRKLIYDIHYITSSWVNTCIFQLFNVIDKTRIRPLFGTKIKTSKSITKPMMNVKMYLQSKWNIFGFKIKQFFIILKIFANHSINNWNDG